MIFEVHESTSIPFPTDFKFAKSVTSNALIKIKDSTHFWIHNILLWIYGISYQITRQKRKPIFGSYNTLYVEHTIVLIQEVGNIE